MLKVEKVNENNKQQIMDSLRWEATEHVFALYDLQYDPNHTIMYAVFKNNELTGYILIYTALQFSSVILECEKDLAGQLLEHAPENQFILYTPPKNLSIIKDKFKNVKIYIENWMLVKRGQAKFFKLELVRRLNSEVDAQKLFMLLSNSEERRAGTVESILDFIRKMPTYGVFVKDELVSSALTEEALNNADSAALFVRSNNYPAIRVYGKIGYKKICEKLWIDIGTGLKP